MNKKKMPWKEWLLSLGVVGVTVISVLLLIRWFAPQLLGIRADMQVVQVNKSIVPFFENVFRKEDYASPDFILKDPYASVRAKPLFTGLGSPLGPHDILGFRNRDVPFMADVVVIGDSQTYGNNVLLEQNWPSVMTRDLSANGQPRVYSMATGGWGAVQYLNMAQYATAFSPNVIVVAFYSGNDAVESFQMAYGVERWSALRTDPKLDIGDLPKTSGFPPPLEELWLVKMHGNEAMYFSPRLRLAANDRKYASVKAGYAIMLEVARNIVKVAQSADARVVFTILPSKELAYAERLKRDGVVLDDFYRQLITDERVNIDELAKGIAGVPGAVYVDTLGPLQHAALSGQRRLYPGNFDGHPFENGYRTIAQSLSPVVRKLLPPSRRGLVGVRVGKDSYQLCLIRNGGYWVFASTDVLLANGWKPGEVPQMSFRDVERLRFSGTINHAEPSRFGPASVR